MALPSVFGVKSAVIRGWRERWSDERWGVAVRQQLPRGHSGDSCQLAGLLFVGLVKIHIYV